MSTSDVLVSLAGTPESNTLSPDVLANVTLLADGDVELTYESEGPLRRLPVRADGIQSENAFHRIENLQA